MHEIPSQFFQIFLWTDSHSRVYDAQWLFMQLLLSSLIKRFSVQKLILSKFLLFSIYPENNVPPESHSSTQVVKMIQISSYTHCLPQFPRQTNSLIPKPSFTPSIEHITVNNQIPPSNLSATKFLIANQESQ